MHKDSIVSSPKRCVESDELLFTEEVLCLFLSYNEFFLHQCGSGPLKDVSRSRMLLLDIAHLINSAPRFFIYDGASESGESGKKPFHESIRRLDGDQAAIINNTLARSGMETDKVQYDCEIRRRCILIKAWR